jgi:hypothetical protein
MAKNGIKLIRVSDDFSRYLCDIQHRIKEDTGQEISQVNLTSVIAAIRPSINMPHNGEKKKRRGTIFDF